MMQQNRIGQFIEEKIIFNPTEGERTVRKKDLSEELKIWYDVTLGIKTNKPKINKTTKQQRNKTTK